MDALLKVMLASAFIVLCTGLARDVTRDSYLSESAVSTKQQHLEKLTRILLALRPLALGAPSYETLRRNNHIVVDMVTKRPKKNSGKRKAKHVSSASGKGFGVQFLKNTTNAPKEPPSFGHPGAVALESEEVKVEQDSNPLLDLMLHPAAIPHLQSLTHINFASSMPVIVSKTREDFKNFEERLSSLPCSFDELLGARDKTLLAYRFAVGIRSFLAGVKDAENWDSPVEGEESLEHDILHSRPWYDALRKLRSQDLTEVQSRVVEAELRERNLVGLDLTESARSKLDIVNKDLSRAMARYNPNQETYAVTLSDPAMVAGMTPSARKAASERAERYRPRTSPQSGPWTFEQLTEMACLPSSSLREKFYRGFYREIDESTSTNCDVIPDILRMRHQRAQLLGFRSHAEMQLGGKRMAGSVQEVDEFLATLFAKASPIARAELKKLQAFANENGFQGELQEWDVQFWESRFTNETCGIDMESTRPYFVFPKLLDHLLELARTIFGIEVRRKDDVAEVWHQDVMYFEAFDEATKDSIGSFYIDPFYRPEDKRPGNYVSLLRSRSSMLGIKPLVSLVTEINPPRQDIPALMTWREGKILFHEFGHLLHALLAEDFEGTELDMVEFPSIFMESFFFQDVNKFATHYETGEPLPSDLAEKLKQSRSSMAGARFLDLLEISAVDMEWHARYSPKEEQTYQDVLSAQRHISEKYYGRPVNILKEQFSKSNHLFKHGYDAGFYSYLWSEVASVDAFAAFQEVGFNDTIALGTLGRHFRRTVLEGLGSRHPFKLYNDFRGRDVAMDAMLRQYGLSSTSD